MGIVGLELPTGTLDHKFGHSAVGEIVAGLFSVEPRPFSAIAYGYYHHTGVYGGVRQSGNVFAGVGTAWTPIDDEPAGKLLSIQLGLSHERTFAAEQDGVALGDSGAPGFFLHPGVVACVTPKVQVFALLSVPLTQHWRAAADRQQFRFGAGTIVNLGR